MDLEQVQLARAGERVFRLLVDTVEDYAMCAMDTDGRIANWNVGAARTYGYGEAEVIGRSLAMLFTEEDRRAGAPESELRTAAEQGRSEEERWHVRKDGSRFWALGLVIPVREADGSLVGFGKIIRDRTDLKQLQEALRHHAAELERANEEKSVFIATLAHELRNPLNVLAQVGELLKRPSRMDPLQLSQMIARQIQHTRRLLDDLTDIVRLGRNKLALRRTPLDLRDALRRAAEMVQPEADRRGILLQVSVPDVTVDVAGDNARLVQVFANLLGNAVKFSPEQSPVAATLTREAEEAVTRIVDRGAGIPSDQLTSIFELFSQAHSDRPTSEAGLGIGLALTRDLVLLHGGTVQARSQGLGAGSEFIVRLPLVSGGQGIASV